MPELDFDALISPISRDQFLAEYWETKPLRITRDHSNYYESIIAGSDIDYLLSVACLLDRDGVELLGAKELRGGSEKKPASALYQAYRDGASFRIRGINRFWKPIWTLCIRMQELFGFQVAANLYCTPAASRALDRHYDLHDTMLLQIAGSKQWRVFDSPIELPIEHVPLMRFERPVDGVQYRGAPVIRDVTANYKPAEPIDEFVLEPGDFLYLPRGFVHEAHSTDSISAHVTIGVYPTTWVDLIAVALGQLAHKNVRLRKALPAGPGRLASASLKENFERLLDEISKSTDLKETLEEIEASLTWNQQAIGEGSIADSEATQIDVETVIERRPGLMCRLVVDGEFVRLAACHGDLSLPRFFEKAIRFVAENQRFNVGDIPGGLSDHSKIMLARRLIDDRFFRAATNLHQ
jgi:ribosomal protein L16 Arg81 hydroxylase